MHGFCGLSMRATLGWTKSHSLRYEIERDYKNNNFMLFQTFQTGTFSG